MCEPSCHENRRTVYHTFLISLLAVVAILCGCQTVPETGRTQWILISRGEERRMGEKAYAAILQKSALSSNSAAVEVVRRVGTRIAAVTDAPDYDWEFNLIESSQQNAFVLPGGKVGVYTGISSAAETEGGLATVLSHEIAHAIRRHGAERVTQGLLIQLGGVALSVAMDGKDPGLRDQIFAAYGLGTDVGIMLPYSRTHELEADQVGLLLMARAGYDPNAAVEFWEQFTETKEGRAPLEFLSTHPSDERRLQRLREFLPAALQEYQMAADKYDASTLLPK